MNNYLKSTICFVGLLTACTGVDTKEQQIQASCLTVASAKDALVVINNEHPLSAANQKAVDSAIVTADAVCTVQPQPTLDSLEQVAFNAAVAKLQAILLPGAAP